MRGKKDAKANNHVHKISRRSYIKNNYQLYLMLILPLLYLLLFKYKPMLGAVAAFKKFNIFVGIMDSDWVGLAHFEEAFSSAAFWLSLKNTLVLNLGDIILGFPVPIILALFLYELNNKYIKKATQLILYLPNFLSWVIIAGIISQVCANNGLLNRTITALGGTSIDFLTTPSIWRIVYWITGIWQGAGYGLIIYLAALTGTDPNLSEAAYIDGAGRMKRILFITIPQIKGTITVMLIMALGKVISIGFERPFMMGNTLVKNASEVISTYVYSVGLQAGRFDFATAIGLFQSVIGVILILVVNALAKKFGEEGII